MNEKDFNFTRKNLEGLSHLKEIRGQERLVRVQTHYFNDNIVGQSEDLNRQRKLCRAISMMEHYCTSIEKGMLPDTKVLMFIADAFEKHLKKGQELDIALGISGIQAKGSAVEIYNRNKIQFRFFMDIIRFIVDEELSQEKAIGKTIDLYIEKDKEKELNLTLTLDNIKKMFQRRYPNKKAIIETYQKQQAQIKE